MGEMIIYITYEVSVSQKRANTTNEHPINARCAYVCVYITLADNNFLYICLVQMIIARQTGSETLQTFYPIFYSFEFLKSVNKTVRHPVN
jgi:hypothetical protein